MGTSIREAIEASVAQLEGKPNETEGTEQQSAVPGEQDTATPAAAEDKPSATPAPAAKEEKPAAKPAAPTGDKPTKTPEGEVKPQAAPTQSSLKAPVSWRPQVREAFGKLPPEVQEEVTRREQEINNGLREASEARRLHREFQETVTPYLAQIQAEGATPMQAFKSLLNTSHILRVGTPQQKALMAAQTITQFGIDINLLDQMLMQAVQGRAPQADPVFNAVQQQLAPVMDFMKQMQGATTQFQQHQESALEQELTAFANDPKNEFYADVAGDIADILEMGAKAGRKITLQQAYDKAIMLHPDISEVVSKRALAAQAAQKSTAAKAARKAGASVGGGSLPQNEGKPAVKDNSRRAAIEAAIEQLSDGT